MKGTSIKDCSLIKLNKISNLNGNISIVEENATFPFKIERIYYLYDVPNHESRGGHAHKELYQLIVAASGSFNISIFDGLSKISFFLNKPNEGLLIVPGIWRELDQFASGSICLVLASKFYNEDDYIRIFPEYINYKI